MSKRTLKLQRRFIQLQLIQGLAPLVIMAIPLSVFVLCFLLSLDGIGSISQVQTIGFYAMPSLQSAVYLRFVWKSTRAKRKQQPNFESR
ncbi:hypothetical protein PENTCL1PPCAC_19498, partial [Pristionchus entomophagus]